VKCWLRISRFFERPRDKLRETLRFGRCNFRAWPEVVAVIFALNLEMQFGGPLRPLFRGCPGLQRANSANLRDDFLCFSRLCGAALSGPMAGWVLECTADIALLVKMAAGEALEGGVVLLDRRVGRFEVEGWHGRFSVRRIAPRGRVSAVGKLSGIGPVPPMPCIRASCNVTEAC
jgi:hypothetical protein